METGSEYISYKHLAPETRIAVAMSGGVDSAVAACLLREAGLSVEGFTLSMFSPSLLSEEERAVCPVLSGGRDAKETADALGFRHTLLSAEAEFRNDVIDPFVASYIAGETPNPCVECNRHLKFGTLLQRTKELGFSHLATGHYCRLQKTAEGRYLLFAANDRAKDQTYMLWRLSQEMLAHTLFPLGEYTKAEVREIAQMHGLTPAVRKDSQDICFIPSGDYGAFLLRDSRRSFPEGDFLSPDGRVLGRHKGIIHYTVGQRKGLGIALGEPMYVAKKDAEANTVTLDRNEGLFTRSVDVREANLIALASIETSLRAEAKVRYHGTAVPATVWQIGADRLHVEFDEAVRAATPGQSLVLYDGDCLVGGGIITEK